MVYFILAIQCLYPKPNPKRFSKGDFLYHPTGIYFSIYVSSPSCGKVGERNDSAVPPDSVLTSFKKCETS